MVTEVKTELKRCKCCHCNKLEGEFDFKKDNTRKLTCRKCLFTAKVRFQAKPSIAIYKDIKKIRMEIMAEIHSSDDSGILTTILTNIKRSITQSSQNLPSAPSSQSDGNHDTTTATSTSPDGIAAILPQTLDQLQ